MIDKGTIVTVIRDKFIEFPSEKWEIHFVPMKKHYIALETPSNNGSFRAKDSRGKLAWLHISEVI